MIQGSRLFITPRARLQGLDSSFTFKNSKAFTLRDPSYGVRPSMSGRAHFPFVQRLERIGVAHLKRLIRSVSLSFPFAASRDMELLGLPSCAIGATPSQVRVPDYK